VPHRAFTLIEVMAVVVLLGLLASASVLTLTEQVQHCRQADVLDRLTHEDHLARLAARRLGHGCILRLDLDRQRLWRADTVGAEEGLTHGWKLPAGYRMARVLQPAGSSDLSAAGQLESNTTTGIADVSIGVGGYSATYAIQVVTASPAERRDAAGTREEPSLWLVFAGLTGQRTVMQHEEEVHNLLAALAAPRPDAR